MKEETIQKLYYYLGYLEGLQSISTCNGKDIYVIKEFIDSNPFFDEDLINLSNKKNFANENTQYDDYQYDDYQYDDSIDHGNDYVKYGGYNGYSDDIIDSVFEGDPLMTWNVD